MPQPLQPFLHDLALLLAAPTQALSLRTGDILASTDRASAQGLIHADVRVLSEATVLVDGLPGEHIATELAAGRARFTTLLRHVGAGLVALPDPQVRLDRLRRVAAGLLAEEIVISSVLPVPVDVSVTLRLSSDLAPVERVKVGKPARPLPFDEIGDSSARWGDNRVRVELTADGAALSAADDPCALTAVWRATVPAHASATLTWQVSVAETAAVVTAATAPPLVAPAPSATSDHRLVSWLNRSLEDLTSLRMATPEAPGDSFLAAGAPWYLTLFGRDSLWAARMLLPLDLGTARGTLRTLARLQGSRVDAEAAEEPGKIAHELRGGQFAYAGLSLPPLYYGTIDATQLWICLLHDAWRAGLTEDDVADLLPALERALGWLTDFGDADGDGFFEYFDTSGHGLVNQGWKDSADSVRFHDGTMAEGPVALCEVQGYAYEAAMSGAALLDAFGRPGGAELRAWADRLAQRFRASFWCGEGETAYPALALDGAKRRVDSLTSNIGHLLGTGMLNAEEEQAVARHLAGPALDSGLGLRTMADTDAGYSPLSYHCGSVWPHDTAIAIRGMVRSGLAEHAGGLVEGLLRASVAFDQRLPELWSGEGRPVPYPAACRPQAWSAAAAVVVATQAMGAVS